MTDITYHLAEVRARIERALERAGRAADSVTIVAVSKQQPADVVKAAFLAGQCHFGENYVQEALGKMSQLRDVPLIWHYIGRIQSNKARHIAEQFDWVHTVDRLSIATRLHDHRPWHADPLNVFIQVNQTGRPDRAGVLDSELEPLAREMKRLTRLRVRGLMTIPLPGASHDDVTAQFRRLRRTGEALADAGLTAGELSIGMSADFERAIAEGATCVRIGTAIFGQREH